MNLNKFTDKAQEAVLESQNLAQSLGHQTIEPEHLLLSLIRQTDGIVPQVLQKLNQSPDQLAAILERDLQRSTACVRLQRADGPEPRRERRAGVCRARSQIDAR